MQSNCPCESGLLYAECCKPFHDGTPAPTALQLMRSRYSAYALGLVAYIQQTQVKPADALQLLEFCKTTQFCGLKILGSGPDWVEFAASLKQNGRLFTMREKSRFQRVDGRWLYVDGATTFLDA